MIPAKGCVKNYHWGQVGEDNHIARFNSVAPRTPTRKSSKDIASEQNNNNGSIVESKKSAPLAELWFGSHPSGPSTLIVGDQMIKLDEFLTREPEMVGVIEQFYKYDKQLPFLFKILSVAQPLSLQAHPDKKLAQVLHKKDPKNYPDANHKPELAIALTEFHVLCDFRPHSEIIQFVDTLPPLKQIIGEKTYDHYKGLVPTGRNNNLVRAALGECFKRLMLASKETILAETKSLFGKYSSCMSKELYSVVVELNNLYPGDPGVFAPLFLNYLKLQPGEAIFLKANKLHAYLRGECIECMACSDNVVRAGLTTKFRDVQTLLEMLDYETVKTGSDLLLLPKIHQVDADCSHALFAPTEEFQVERIAVSNKQEHVLPSVRSGSFIIVLNGKAAAKDFFDLKTRHKLCPGFACFVPPKIQLKLTNIQGTLMLYRAFC